jgi:hypothetical protein
VGRPQTTAAPAASSEGHLKDLLERLGTEPGYVRLYRVQLGRKLYLKKLGTEIEIDDIQETWGGGEYILQVVRAGGKLVGEQRIEIAGAPKDPDAAPAAEAAPAGTRVPRNVAESVLELERVVHEMRNPPKAAEQGNPLLMAAALITAIGTAATPIIEYFRDRPKPQGGAGAERLMNAYHKGLRTGMALKEGNGGSGVGDILGKTLETVRSIASNHRGGELLEGEPLEEEAPAAQLPPPVKGVVGRRPPPAASSAPLPAGAPEWAKVVAKHVGQMQALAQRVADPHSYADLLYQNAPDQLLELIVEQVGRGEDFWEEFENAFPGTDRVWFSDMLGRVFYLASLPDDDDAGDPGAVPPDNDAARG